MTDMNHVSLIGNLTRDVTANEYDFSYTSGGTARANISMAVNRSRKQGDQWVDDVSYFDVTVWGKTAENLKPYFTKGQKVAVSGFLKQDRWEKDGQKHSKISIVAENIQLVGGRTENKDQNNSESNTGYSNSNKGYSKPKQELKEDEFIGSGYEDPSEIPF